MEVRVWDEVDKEGELSGKYKEMKRKEIIEKINEMKRWINKVKNIEKIKDRKVEKGKSKENKEGIGIIRKDKRKGMVEKGLKNKGENKMEERKMKEKEEMRIKKNKKSL